MDSLLARMATMAPSDLAAWMGSNPDCQRVLSDNQQRLPAVLATLTPAGNAVLRTNLLHALPLGADLLQHAPDLFADADPKQVAFVRGRFVEVAKRFARHAQATGMGPEALVLPPRHAMERARQSPLHITDVDAEFLRVCLLSRHYAVAARELREEQRLAAPGLSVEGVLTYQLYSAMVHIGRKEFDAALQALTNCIAAPADVASAIQLEAYKKWVLLWLLRRGRVPKPPRFASKVARELLECAAEYTALQQAYATGDLDAVIARHAAEYTRDANMGLVRQVRTRHTRDAIRKLTETFLTLSLDAIAAEVGLATAAEAEAVLVSMIGAGEIFAIIDQPKGTVSFRDSPDSFESPDTLAALQERIAAAAALYDAAVEADGKLRTDPAYVRSAGGDHHGAGALSFDPGIGAMLDDDPMFGN